MRRPNNDVGAAVTWCAAGLRRLAHGRAAAPQAIEDRNRALHGELAGLLIEGLGAAGHHVAMQDAREDMHLDVLHARWHRAIGLEHLRRRSVILVAPDDAD